MKPYYLYNLNDYEELQSELNSMYESTIDLSFYKTVVYRGSDERYHSKINKFESYDEAKGVYDFIVENDKTYAQINLCGDSLDWSNYPKIYKWIKNKSFEIFGDDLIIRKSETTGNIVMPSCKIDSPLKTLYMEKSILQNHRDHQYNMNSSHLDFIKPANILIYLNKNYDKNNGGIFIVEDEMEVIPEYGNIVFLNFMNGSDPSHQVSEIVGEQNRFALLFNITYSKKQREILKIK
jgi:hypothetical protein